MIRKACGLGGLIALGVGMVATGQSFDPAPVDDDGLSELERELGFDAETPARNFSQEQTANLRALDKITGRSTDFEMTVGDPRVFGSLRIDLQVCFQTPPEEPPESVAFLKITTAVTRQVQSMAVPRQLTDDERALTESGEAETRFSGWMFASSPGLNALEHPVYDIWVINCKAVEPVMPDASNR